jgi:type VI secretion system protein ImpM
VSGRDLSDEGFAGFFGKLPCTGDFVWRGLPDSFRARWDGWITRHLARREGVWPDGGLRFTLASGARTASGLVVASRDSQGRRFPLSALFVVPSAPSPRDVDAWCDAALGPVAAAMAGELDADALWSALTALPLPAQTDLATSPLVLWRRGREPLTSDPSDPGDAFDSLFSCS